jgi:hypothetical protein
MQEPLREVRYGEGFENVEDFRIFQILNSSVFTNSHINIYTSGTFRSTKYFLNTRTLLAGDKDFQLYTN